MSISKVNIPLPFGHKNQKFKLHHNVVTTQDFSYLTCINAREMVPGDSFKAHVQSFVRCAPLVVPTFGDVSIESFAFFVPFRILWADAVNYFTNTTSFDTVASAHKPGVPFARNNDFVQVFVSYLTSVAPAGTPGDFSLSPTPTATTSSNYVFSSKGKRIYYLLLSLGYSINFSWKDSTPLSLAPILAYCKIFHEYFLPGLFYPNANLESLFRKSYADFDPVNSSGTAVPDYTTLKDLLLNIPYYTYLSQDYFTAAWQSPVGSTLNNTVDTYISYYDEATFTEAGGSNYTTSTRQSIRTDFRKHDGTPSSEVDGYPRLYDAADGASSGTIVNKPITQLALNALQSLTSVVMRNSLAGNKFVDRFLARFGVKSSPLVLQRPVFLGSARQPLQVSDVMCNADTEQGSTGDYAGKGISYGKGTFSYNAEEPGLFMVFSVVQARAGFGTGRRRELVMHLDPYDFYTPEFDRIGTQPIRNDEIFADYFNYAEYDAGQNNGGNPVGVFGFAPRYTEYKTGYDMLGGDFRLSSRNTDLECYHLMRTILPPGAGSILRLSDSFLSAAPDSMYNGFDRIFADQSTYRDHFICTHQIDITAYRPMHQIGDSFDILDSDGARGKTVTLDNGGSRLT